MFVVHSFICCHNLKSTIKSDQESFWLLKWIVLNSKYRIWRHVPVKITNGYWSLYHKNENYWWLTTNWEEFLNYLLLTVDRMIIRVISVTNKNKDMMECQDIGHLYSYMSTVIIINNNLNFLQMWLSHLKCFESNPIFAGK